jgi:hypothetical protein
MSILFGPTDEDNRLVSNPRQDSGNTRVTQWQPDRKGRSAGSGAHPAREDPLLSREGTGP